MVLAIPENMQLLLGGSADSMADLPQQAFALTLSDDVLEGMIESVRNGQEIQLSLGDAPAFHYANQEIQISQPSADFSYDLFFSQPSHTQSLTRLPSPAMSILSAKHRGTVLRHVQASKPQTKANAKGRDSKESPRMKDKGPRNVAARAMTQAEKEQADIDALSAGFRQAEADRAENSTRILEGTVEIKGGKLKAGRGQLLSRPSTRPGSQPGSPALSGMGSPSLGPTSHNPAQERARKLRFPLIHELAVRDMTFGDLLPKWQGETDADFHTHLEKVADFKADSQRWSLARNHFKDLDVWAYPYANDGVRQTAIDNAVKRYDQMRLPVSDPHWQKLLPISERGKGICLSKVQAAIAKGPVAPAPKINVQSPKPSSPSLDSEREDSASSSNNKQQPSKLGSEPMARTNSAGKTKKMSEAQAQAKRLVSGKPPKAATPKPTSKPSSTKSSPKVSPVKTAPKAGGGAGSGKSKDGRVLSKEFISDSDSDSSEEAPLAKKVANRKVQELKDLKASIQKASTAKTSTPKPKAQPVERATEKPKQVEKIRDAIPPKTKPAPAKSTPTVKVRDSIRVEGPKPIRAPKRSRDADDDDDSSSSGTNLSKRIKSNAQAASKPQLQQRPSEATVKQRTADSSQTSRLSQQSSGPTTSSSVKPKASPIKKSSPLASSPPTNASDIDAADERDMIRVAKKRKFESTTAARASEKTGSSNNSSNSDRYEKASNASSDPYDKSDSSDSSLIKRAKHGMTGGGNRGGGSNGTAAAGISDKTRTIAHKFKAYYVQYAALHKELSAMDDPPEDKVHQLLDMHTRLQNYKRQVEEGARRADEH